MSFKRNVEMPRGGMWIPRTYLFHKKFKISAFSRKDWATNRIQLPGGGDIWYTYEAWNGELAGAVVHTHGGNKETTAPWVYSIP